MKSTRVDDVRFDVDHVVPKSEGGGHQLENLQTLCPACHAEKHPGNGKLARRARAFRTRNDPSTARRVLRVLLVVPLLWSVFGDGDDDRTVRDEYGRELTVRGVAEVPELPTDEGVTVEARVEELWSTDAEGVAQLGKLGAVDGSATVRFVAWADADLRELREGREYRLVGAETGRYDGDPQLVLDRLASVVPIE